MLRESQYKADATWFDADQHVAALIPEDRHR